MTDDEFPDAIREVIRDELPGISVCTFAIVSEVVERDQRLHVRLKNDPGWADGDVPLLSIGASGEYGDIPGVRPGYEVLVVFTADDVSDMLAERGRTPQASRRRTPQNAVALPYGPYTADDDVIDHEPGERIIAHPNGSLIRFGTAGQPDLRLVHDSGTEIELDGEPPNIDPGADTSAPRTSPDPTQGTIRLSHPSGVGVTVHDGGISISPGDRDGDDAQGYGEAGYDTGGYGEGGRQQGVFTHREQNDPWRVEMVGDPDRPEEGHRHLVPQADGSYAMTGPPMPMREQFAWFGPRFEELTNSTAPDLVRAQHYYQQWQAWLASQVGVAALDASLDGGDTHDGWPYPEPVPDPPTRDSFRPDGSLSFGYGFGGYDEGGYGE